MLAICLLVLGGASAPQVSWADLDGDGIAELIVTRADGSVAAFRQTQQGLTEDAGMHLVSVTPTSATLPPPACSDSVKDQAASAVCILASSTPTLGMLFPLGNSLSVLANGNVGVGTATPGQRLSVQGVARALSGGLKFSDGTILSTATPVGPPGITGIDGPMGAAGPPGLQGPQGPLSAMASLNQKTGTVTIAAGGNATLTKTGSTLTIGVGPVKCTWGSKSYSPGAKCFETMSSSGCPWGTNHANYHSCQSSGNWSNGYSSVCEFSIQPGPLCGQ